MEIQTILTINGERHVFDAKLHLSKRKKDLLIDPKMFYEAFCRLPKFPHFEIEILSKVWEEIFARSIQYYFSEKHLKYFICWPFRIKSEKEAKRIFSVWSIGTLYTLHYNEDFVEKMKEAEKFYGKEKVLPGFTKFMREKYGIKLIKPA
jgi:hypothetical protein